MMISQETIAGAAAAAAAAAAVAAAAVAAAAEIQSKDIKLDKWKKLTGFFTGQN